MITKAAASDLLWERFVNREDVYARQWFNADRGMGYARQTEGECPMSPPCPKRSCPHIRNVPITKKIIGMHLDGKVTVGLFQLSEENTVKWLCLDVDISKSAHGTETEETLKRRVRSHTMKTAQVLRSKLGPNSFLVEYSGSKGYHLWVFFNEAVQARYAASLGNWLVDLVMETNGIHTEIFPKQTALRSYGNLVKMPLGIHLKTNQRCVFVDANFEKYEDQFEKLANVRTFSAKELEGILKKYEIPTLDTIRVEGSDRTVGKGSLPCMVNIMTEGLHEGTRDHGVFRLSVYLRDKGLPYWATQAVAEGVNNKSNPPLSDADLDMKIASAYDSDYSVFPCSEPAIDSFCSSSCKFWQGKLADRWLRLDKNPKEAIGRISRD